MKNIFNPELQFIIIKYIECVKYSIDTINVGLKLGQQNFLTRFIVKPPQGEFELNGINKYFFHGFGCTFENDHVNITWDVGSRNRLCVLDPFFISEFSANNLNITTIYNNANEIKLELEKAAEMNLIEKNSWPGYQFKIIKERKRGINTRLNKNNHWNFPEDWEKIYFYE